MDFSIPKQADRIDLQASDLFIQQRPEQSDRLKGDELATDLVTREGVFVDEEHTQPCAAGGDRRCASGGTGAHDADIERGAPGHSAIASSSSSNCLL